MPGGIDLHQLGKVQFTVSGVVKADFVGLDVIEPLHPNHGALMHPSPVFVASQDATVAGFHRGLVKDVCFQKQIGIAKDCKVMAAAFLFPAFVAVMAFHRQAGWIINDIHLGGKEFVALGTCNEMQVIQAILIDGFPVLQVALVQGDHGMVKVPRSRFFVIILAEKAGHHSSLYFNQSICKGLWIFVNQFSRMFIF